MRGFDSCKSEFFSVALLVIGVSALVCSCILIVSGSITTVMGHSCGVLGNGVPAGGQIRRLVDKLNIDWHLLCWEGIGVTGVKSALDVLYSIIVNCETKWLSSLHLSLKVLIIAGVLCLYSPDNRVGS